MSGKSNQQVGDGELRALERTPVLAWNSQDNCSNNEERVYVGEDETNTNNDVLFLQDAQECHRLRRQRCICNFLVFLVIVGIAVILLLFKRGFYADLTSNLVLKNIAANQGSSSDDGATFIGKRY